MLKEYIDTILEAEAEAERILQRANEQARELTMRTESEIEESKIALQNENKRQMKAALEQAQAEGETQAAAIFAQGQAESQASIQQAQANVEKAVALIRRRMLDVVG